MKRFEGFPARMEFTAVPNLFFSGLLPHIDDLAELKTTLAVMAAIYRKKGSPRYVSLSELGGDAALMQGLKAKGKETEAVLKKALEMAVARGTLLHLGLEGEEGAEDVYFVNDAPGRQAVAKIESGELKLGGMKAVRPVETAGEPPDIFTLYEENIGLLTPLVADELRDAEKRYPAEWLRDAIKEAVLHNKRNIKYITKILENWSVAGRSDGTYQRDSQKADPDKYIKGKYGHMVRR
jgi:DNA replication protein